MALIGISGKRCIPENIRRACVGLSKTAKNYKWKYKN